MSKLRTKFERFCYKNRDKGIPNLMLYVALGSAIVCILSMFNGGTVLYSLLAFDKTKILEGQLWRLITYVFTQSGTSLIDLLFLYFFYMLGRYVELSMGTFRFNLFYLSGVILMDVFAMLFCPIVPDVITSQEQYTFLMATVPNYSNMAYYLHLSLILTFATTHPDSEFRIFFIIPIKAWVMALFYLLLTFISIFNMSYPVLYFPHNLFPLVALGNYLLFMGSDIKNVLPPSWRAKLHRRSSSKARSNVTPITFRAKNADNAREKTNYTHRCTICGRTDVSDPELEFRYCSRCNGYYCYCQDHINNHTHVE